MIIKATKIRMNEKGVVEGGGKQTVCNAWLQLRMTWESKYVIRDGKMFTFPSVITHLIDYFRPTYKSPHYRSALKDTCNATAVVQALLIPPRHSAVTPFLTIQFFLAHLFSFVFMQLHLPHLRKDQTFFIL